MCNLTKWVKFLFNIIILDTATLPCITVTLSRDQRKVQSVTFLSLKDLKEVFQPRHMAGCDKGGMCMKWCHSAIMMGP